MSEDAWAHEVFGPARSAPEPDWRPDGVALLHAGRRRTTVRRLRAGGLVLAAVTATVATLGATLTGGTGGPAPRPAATPTKPSLPPAPLNPQQLAAYVSLGSFQGKWRTSSSDPAVPAAAEHTMANLVVHLDPGLGHLRTPSPYPSKLNVVGDDTPEAQNVSMLSTTSLWTVDGDAASAVDFKKPSGRLSVTFWGATRRMRPTGDSSSATAEGCGIGYPEVPAHGAKAPVWSQCTVVTLADGSKVETASVHVGAGTVIRAAREFPGGAGGVVLDVADFWEAAVGAQDVDASKVVTPAPWTEHSLAAVLSDPALSGGLASDADPHGPAGFLAAADLGRGWSYNEDQAAHPGDLPLDNFGCGAGKTAKPVTPGRGSGYTGQLSSGASGTVQEADYRFGPGQAASDLAAVHGSALTKCPALPGVPGPVDVLPPGIGDEGFVVYGPGYRGAEVYIRVGDTILELQVMASGTLSAADREWLVRLAGRAAAEYAAEGGKP